jgi:hypothetical protein
MYVPGFAGMFRTSGVLPSLTAAEKENGVPGTIVSAAAGAATTANINPIATSFI